MNLPLINDRFLLHARIALGLSAAVMLVHALLNPGCGLELLPYFWLLQLAALVLFLPAFNADQFRFLVLVLCGSVAVEFIAQGAAKIYGELEYGDALGVKVKGVPLALALQSLLLNWCALVMASRIKTGVYLQALLGAGLVAAAWALMEPPAAAFDLWSWKTNAAPLQRYLACFVVAFFFQLLGQSMNFEKRHPLSLVIFACQVLLFSILVLTKTLQ